MDCPRAFVPSACVVLILTLVRFRPVILPHHVSNSHLRPSLHYFAYEKFYCAFGRCKMSQVHIGHVLCTGVF